MDTLVFLYLIYSLQNPWNYVHSSPSLKKIYTNSHLSFSNSPPNKLVKEIYEAGHLIANPDLCPDLGKDMKLMILVISALHHSESRMAIRQTWGFHSQRHNISIGFIVGSYKQSSENAIIQTEQQTYGDLIQARNVDSYNNLTLKTLSMLEWVDNYCSQVPFVLKTDDDMFINIPSLLAQLEKQQQAKRSIFGRLAHEWKPVRNVDSKYYLSKSEYEPDIFPDFVTGPAYLMTQDSVHDLHHQALNMSFLKLEDVFITGVVADSIGIRVNDAKEFRNDKISLGNAGIHDAISIHEISPKEQFLFWAHMMTKKNS